MFTFKDMTVSAGLNKPLYVDTRTGYFWTERQTQSLWFGKKLWKQIRLEREKPECLQNKKKRKREAGKLVHIACFRLVPSPRTTVAASWCGFHYLSSIYWTILELTLSSAAILAAGQWREQQQRKWKGRSCSVTAHSGWTESLFAQLDIHEKDGFIKFWCCHLATLAITCF